MTIKNPELVKKTITAADDLATSGKLNPAQADKFIDFVIQETVLGSLVRVVRFRNEQFDIDKLGLGSRAAVPKAEAVDPGVRRGITTSKVSLIPVEIMVPLEISDNFVELNIEGASVEDHILRMYARRLANDMEQMMIHGNTAGYLDFEGNVLPGGSATQVIVDSLLALFDGYLILADSGHIVDAAGDAISGSIWRRGMSAMPSKFKKDKSKLRWLVPVEIEEIWRERVSTRATGAGDAALSSQGNLTPFGVEMISVPLMEFHPQAVTVDQISGAGATMQLPDAPVEAGSTLIIRESEALSGVPTTPFIEDTDYSIDSVTGLITDLSVGIPATTDLRISYRKFPEIILTATSNLLLGISRDIRMERARDIFRSVNQYATTVKFSVNVEETDAMVKVVNISDTI